MLRGYRIIIVCGVTLKITGIVEPKLDNVRLIIYN